MLLARKKVFEDIHANQHFFKKLFLYSLPVALLGNWLYVVYGAKVSYVEMNMNMAVSLAGFGFGGPAMTLVYISILVHVYHHRYFVKITHAISKTGRMALTNYLMQSLIATTIFFSYGLGLYGQVNIWQGMMLAVAVYILQVIFSSFWLKYYLYGPLEWLWRSLTYQKMQPLRRNQV
jgi:uncharacterized protein